MRISGPIAALLLSAASLSAFQARPTLDCNDRNFNNRNNRRISWCEMREQTLPASGMVTVDGRQNGGVSIRGWERSEVLVRAQVQTSAATEAEARSFAQQVRVDTAGSQIRADGPPADGELQWSVSYEIFIPQRSSVSVRTNNGGISISDVIGEVEFHAANGGVSLKRVGGNVRGNTTNGGLHIELDGGRWEGNGMDVSTTNGGVTVTVPAAYSAQFETATVNGNIHSDFALPVQLREQRSALITLGTGGAMLRATTTNGGVNIRRK
jgi:DUF4097 and DUF4098 domain-containing protein YvlB